MNWKAGSGHLQWDHRCKWYPVDIAGWVWDIQSQSLPEPLGKHFMLHECLGGFSFVWPTSRFACHHLK